MINKNKFILFLLFLLIITISGCSLFAPRTQTVTIDGVPADATVILNGKRIQCPASLEVPRNKDLNLSVYKDGYKTFEQSYGHKIGPIGMLDLLGGYIIILPLIGLISPGAFELQQDTIYYVLEKNSAQHIVIDNQTVEE